jgi:UDP-N-acetylglucosamine acyltransferase
MTKIHPSAIVEKGAELDSNVEVGPFCYIGKNVKIRKNTKLLSHISFMGDLSVGESNTFFPYCSVGSAPQDLSYKGEPTKVIIGNDNTFREFVSINRGTTKQDFETFIGNNNLFMAYTHIGHDVKIQNYVRIVNSCNLAGHVSVGEGAIISGASNISQFITIGKGAFIGGGSAIDRDIPCYCTAYGNRVKLKGINIIGLKRTLVEKVIISEVVDFYRTMESSALSPRSYVDSSEAHDEFGKNTVVLELMDFIRESKIGIPPFMS